VGLKRLAGRQCTVHRVPTESTSPNPEHQQVLLEQLTAHADTDRWCCCLQLKLSESGSLHLCASNKGLQCALADQGGSNPVPVPPYSQQHQSGNGQAAAANQLVVQLQLQYSWVEPILSTHSGSAHTAAAASTACRMASRQNWCREQQLAAESREPKVWCAATASRLQAHRVCLLLQPERQWAGHPVKQHHHHTIYRHLLLLLLLSRAIAAVINPLCQPSY
jgi:hypothetical protein